MANENEGRPEAGERPSTSTEELRAKRRESRTSRTYTLFLRDLEAKAGVDRPLAERAAESVLCTLEQRLMGQEVEHLEAQLPQKVRDLLQRCPRHEGLPPRKFKMLEFLQMVSDDLDTTPNEAERLTRAVFATVRAHISEGEAEDVIGQLPADLRALWVPEA
ncbi:DUF2267 domain-containing protein [Myxococcus sp. CA051A]|uniref:DUF2267 domain-containing protein n=1 Tax=Myxococcus llanfairpwllgwyngyllgogerychwyrndrobwllllantysiliogogogochensis TaxID=2590453 RepID=A0A540WKK4_9BACT|nr:MULTISPECIES: DUF2267 domain-containing protein [Myxococcus]NTX05942.1 DUF2267 domain-containing protein [Myxococcus sp. CA040A]NTX10553.1 DUF2267 domain-containing protein [Myxococcus sp. CA056]NTX38188.1 DUF2267 domain-containing protein [Myxococcus sp. CA033]NTX58187.1 DUF2267 domain-containing protein [Myxococcus sp. CA039A]NTX63340.1 DUF2267 domain-containing protein [Myxococcus sp. CA051A]